MGIIGLVIALVISETMHADHRLAAGVVPALRDMMMRVRSLLSKRSFTAMALIVGVAGLAYMGYIAVASYILLDDFDSGYVIYNLVYAGICGVSVLAPFVYLRISKMMSPRALTVLCAVLGLVAAAFMAVFGIWGPFAFFCCFVPYALMEGIIRPHAFVVLLDQPPDQVGSASAFANFVYTMLGAAGTVVMTLPWTSYVGGLAIVMGACSIIMLALYAWGLRK